jgi:hypothetical protein
MSWMIAVPAALSLGVNLATLCPVLTGGAYHQPDATNRWVLHVGALRRSRGV